MVNLTTTDSSTSLMVEVLLPAITTYKLSMTVNFDNATYEPCIVYSTCTNCYGSADCQAAKLTNFFDVDEITVNCSSILMCDLWYLN